MIEHKRLIWTCDKNSLCYFSDTQFDQILIHEMDDATFFYFNIQIITPESYNTVEMFLCFT